MPRRKATPDKPRADPALLRTLGAQLRRLREDRRLSQEKLAELSGLNYKHVGRIELGKAEPCADALVRLARGLRVPIGELFETVTPSGAAPARPPTADVDAVTAALNTLTSAVARLASHQARPAPVKAPRRTRR